jgi:hypothetical protein
LEKVQNPIPICKSVFKSGENTTSKMQFTKTWIEMINKIEKGKVINFSKR